MGALIITYTLFFFLGGGGSFGCSFFKGSIRITIRGIMGVYYRGLSNYLGFL